MGVDENVSTKEQLKQLMAVKDKLEAQISAYGEVLVQNGNVGMHGRLVDEESYPRSDIDIYKVREARQKIICLQNDHRELMTQIESLLHRFHAEERSSSTPAGEVSSMSTKETEQPSSSRDADQPSSSQAHNTEMSISIEYSPKGSDDMSISEETEKVLPFVIVNFVSPGSPAETAGLKAGDKIVRFGSLNKRNYNNNLLSIATLAKNMQDQNVHVTVLRENQLQELILVPRNWLGRGILGCNILPFDCNEGTSPS